MELVDYEKVIREKKFTFGSTYSVLKGVLGDREVNYVITKMRSVSDLEDYTKIHEKIASEHEKQQKKFVMIFDVRFLEFTADIARKMSDFCKLHKIQRPIYDKFLICTLVIVTNASLRNIVNTALSTFPPSRPVKFVEPGAKAELMPYLAHLADRPK